MVRFDRSMRKIKERLGGITGVFGFISLVLGCTTIGFINCQLGLRFSAFELLNASVGVIVIISIVFLFTTYSDYCNVFEETRKSKYFFPGFLIAIVILNISSIIMFSLYNQNYPSNLEQALNQTMMNYNTDESVMDRIQDEFRCCGVYNSTDWEKIFPSIPLSCKKNGRQFEQGCLQEIETFFRKWSIVVIFGFVVNSVYVVFGTVILVWFHAFPIATSLGQNEAPGFFFYRVTP